jgi:hypothetical protein
LYLGCFCCCWQVLQIWIFFFFIIFTILLIIKYYYIINVVSNLIEIKIIYNII